jgi:hypothetical protein
MSSIPMPFFTDPQRSRIERIAACYKDLTGRDLVPLTGDIAAALWSTPIAVVAQGTEPDPIFFFGNATALRLFECDVAAFTRLPSRFSAEPLLRNERARLLERVTRTGFIDDYAGVRISATGRRFSIRSAGVWNLTDSEGHPAGQAAAFAEWKAIN